METTTLQKPKKEEIDVLELIETETLDGTLTKIEKQVQKVSMCNCPCESFRSESEDVSETAYWNID
jgi:hypothetical protein